ncbi:3'(2'),5'-bisphosphate nucleotidase CysQ [Stutzerimonas kirkiae]|uniref:3'(2'),5'-bisphosphate nucleotidase CysQ n=1 Tax=Stutzerimonas kirkiae TaxID=2211392 RepID=A0A4Q9QXC0_9GAMM|nr:3'(2'),5'-bisphosphate nucleotidase CysQ [Stutzerimonas kirkiae]TBU89286.1 3'(2'),5'-bisphosphate nucleotidase [Stutzerimonas kirkiae]TBU99672.1 3'(2'),5'-bisphosphate nucleotidase [Stutzerimonas kirkiae]TBV12398.1 3'(2'),5'-bisphosphate nucleotidase [Stutzerimonas kirkiae]TBV12591.1 3'(2'),5'-bisphosphate nucleotidase [Stutzerimonas kirkiae]
MSHALIEPVVALVRAAGERILPYWHSELAVREKADASPVTAADLAAHALLDAGLRALDGDIPVLSEEDCEHPLAERAGWTRWWLVDPLDGTKEFIGGSDEFTVNVALIENGRVLFGVVGIPARGTCYYGGAGLGAHCRDADGRIRPLQVRQRPAERFTVVASKRHGSPQQTRLLDALREQHGDLELASIGSSLKFCLLADGLADCYPRLAPTSQWDTAAAQGVLEGAGGEVLDLQGQPLGYEAHDSYLNPFFLALPRGVDWRGELLAISTPLSASAS